MIKKDDAAKMVEEKYYSCSISSFFEEEDCYIFNLVRKDNGIASVASPVKVDKNTGKISRVNFLRIMKEKSNKNVSQDYLDELSRLKQVMKMQTIMTSALPSAICRGI